MTSLYTCETATPPASAPILSRSNLAVAHNMSPSSPYTIRRTAQKENRKVKLQQHLYGNRQDDCTLSNPGSSSIVVLPSCNAASVLTIRMSSM
ncbi:hypothetical protein OUZ56_009402 [Daphnia magna]|uniref:Uncharacterized protein n=1 Tax=Daphnia magna TaxID=35525 RepID=A0ABR0AFX4_9CRUS|nr:hypothetical protein OUZ56_009402 [Daphnia magna]